RRLDDIAQKARKLGGSCDHRPGQEFFQSGHNPLRWQSSTHGPPPHRPQSLPIYMLRTRELRPVYTPLPSRTSHLPSYAPVIAAQRSPAEERTFGSYFGVKQATG